MKIWLICALALISISCATPGIKGSVTDTETKTGAGTETVKSIQIEPLEAKGILAWFSKSKLPAGEYTVIIGDRTLTVKTKRDMKLLDFNANKIGD